MSTATITDAAELIRARAEPLAPIDDPDFAAPFDRFADARVVLLGEASHGTSEFYRARAAITRRLVERHGFTIVAVEADWPDAAAIDRHVRRLPPRATPERPFSRFPTWMWRNTDVDRFVAWLRAHNDGRARGDRAGFYGLDLYNLGGATRAVIDYLDRVDPDAARVARERYGCLTPWRDDPQAYGRRAMTQGYAECQDQVVQMLFDLFSRAIEGGMTADDDFLDAAQNARLVANAEAYYRVMYHGQAESWNLRDTHMADTLDLMREARPGAKAVVWAHNSHIGDARATDMGRARGELNLGQLMRERHGDAARLIGFGTHGGTVAAATDWDGPMEVKRVNPSRPDSWERASHDVGMERFLLDLREPTDLGPDRLERFIGVIYRPDTERWSHYAEASLAEQYDGWVWIDETRAVTPTSDAEPGTEGGAADETWPFGT
jgi:erythromycin esterase-like protein